jgi:hypothetical protein
MEGGQDGMIEYSVMLKRHKGSTRPDVCIFRDENRDVALREMRKYVKQNGFTVYDNDGRFTIADVVLVEKEPIVDSPVISVTPYIKLFNVYDEPIEPKQK